MENGRRGEKRKGEEGREEEKRGEEKKEERRRKRRIRRGMNSDLQAFCFGELSMKFESPATQGPYKGFEQGVSHILHIAHIPIIITW